MNHSLSADFGKARKETKRSDAQRRRRTSFLSKCCNFWPTEVALHRTTRDHYGVLLLPLPSVLCLLSASSSSSSSSLTSSSFTCPSSSSSCFFFFAVSCYSITMAVLQEFPSAYRHLETPNAVVSRSYGRFRSQEKWFAMGAVHTNESRSNARMIDNERGHKKQLMKPRNDAVRCEQIYSYSCRKP